ncbi:MAG TPA: hypothetical protein VM683_07695 [Anaeromyxobacteraceae bacterium]|nr:hypothetical protein [Anaeromyxobacteraceae bacterium]
MAVFLLLAAPVIALGQATGADGLPLQWLWLLAGLLLLAALAWLLFGGGVRRGPPLPHERPPRP